MTSKPKGKGRKSKTPEAPSAARTGRPSKFNEAMLGAVTRLGRLGATDVELAEAREVGTTTITRWQRENAEFRLAVKEGKLEADMNVADALYDRAIGYSHPELCRESARDAR